MKSLISLLVIILFMIGNTSYAQSSSDVSELIEEYKYPVAYHKVDEDVQVAYIDVGKGEQTLLFIHGLATYLPSWYKNIEVLKEKYRCVAIDLPGYGRSTKTKSYSGLKDYASLVIKLINQMELKNVVMVGHSMGGQIATLAALAEPDRFEKLILLAPAGFETFKPEQGTWLKTVFTVESVEQATEEQIRANWALNFYQMSDDVEFMIQDRLKMRKAEDFRNYCEAVVGGMHGMLDNPTFDQLKSIKQKTLVIYGENDGLIPNKYLNPDITTRAVGESGVNQIPDAELKFIPECGHFISFDKPKEINEILINFLSN